MNKACEEETRPTKRQEIPPQVREELQASQQGLCVECGDELVDDYEIDHRIPLRLAAAMTLRIWRQFAATATAKRPPTRTRFASSRIGILYFRASTEKPTRPLC